MPSSLRATLLLLFLVSGFCGLAYQTVWVRLAYAAFGIITPVLSVVVSVFMAGLALGAWLGGRGVRGWTRRTGRSAIFFYAGAELAIAAGAFAVPPLLEASRRLLFPLGEMESLPYLVCSAALLAACILPWCVAMGATFPLMMAFVRERDPAETHSFSFLYLANVLGAMAGTLVTAVVLIELLGFRGTLAVAASLNLAVAGVAALLGRRHPLRGEPPPDEPAAAAAGPAAAPDHAPGFALAVLFLSGFCSMGSEVIWMRAFTPVLGTAVYAFALVLFTYLAATSLGSFVYRWQVGRGSVASTGTLLCLAAAAAFVPVVANDPRLHRSGLAVLASLVPYCALLGYLTPKLVDDYSSGSPRSGGRAYAINVLGSILGPLAASYAVLPVLGARLGLVLLAVPFGALLLWPGGARFPRGGLRPAAVLASAALLAVSVAGVGSFEDGPDLPKEVRRDHTATVISFEREGRKRLLVNGIGMTVMDPVTKVMAHMPLALVPHTPQSAAVICFGMGTTFRSLLSWGVEATAVELAGGVVDAFGFYHDDAARVMADPDARVAVDDGRRFLQRSDDRYDVITIDPPPPVTAAGSSLLYSKDFYELVRRRLREGGILQHWVPGRPTIVTAAVARSLSEVFPHVRAFRALTSPGFHFVASDRPIAIPAAGEFVARMPPEARADLVEWNEGPERDPVRFVERILALEVRMKVLVRQAPGVITDDRPLNEYYVLRRLLRGRPVAW